MQYTKPLPKVNSENEFFWQGCAKQQLLFQICMKCGFIRWPPSDICPECHEGETDYVISEGRGRIYTYVVYHQSFLSEFTADLPYVVSLVELEEGPRLLTNIINCDPNSLHCEMPVIVKWEFVGEEISIPKFEPVAKN